MAFLREDANFSLILAEIKEFCSAAFEKYFVSDALFILRAFAISLSVMMKSNL